MEENKYKAMAFIQSEILKRMNAQINKEIELSFGCSTPSKPIGIINRSDVSVLKEASPNPIYKPK